MSAADRVIRTRDGRIRIVPTHLAAGLISTRRAKPARRRVEVTARVSDVEKKSEPVKSSSRRPVVTAKAPKPIRDPDTDPVDVVDLSDTIESDHVEDTGMDSTDSVDVLDEVTPLPSAPSTRAAKSVWIEYAEAIGVDVTDGMTKAAIQSAARDRLPQPAPTGGRLATPEDEPVVQAVHHDPDTDLV